MSKSSHTGNDYASTDQELRQQFLDATDGMSPSVLIPLIENLTEPFDEQSVVVAKLLEKMPARVRKWIVV